MIEALVTNFTASPREIEVARPVQFALLEERAKYSAA